MSANQVPQAGYYKSGKKHLGVIYFDDPARYLWASVEGSKSSAIHAAQRELGRRLTAIFEVGDLVVYQSPFTGDEATVEYRGKDSWGNATLYNHVTGMQFQTPMENITRKAQQ